MEEKEWKDMTYKEVLNGLTKRIDGMQITLANLDSREVHLQKMIECIQTELDHKARDTDIVEIKGSLKTIAATSTTMKEVRNENKTDNRWIVSTAVTIILFTILLILNRVWKP